MKKRSRKRSILILFFAVIIILIISCPKKAVEKQETQEADVLPAYTVLDRVELLSGGAAGDVLITSFSKATPASVLESTLRRIVKREGFSDAWLYCTSEAYKANMSRSYSEAHPGALTKGYLGSLRSGVFRKAE